MNRPHKIRYRPFLAADLARRFEELAAGRGASKSAIVAAAVGAFLERRGASELGEDEAARAIGCDRFAAFVASVGRRLASGRRAFAPQRAGEGAR